MPVIHKPGKAILDRALAGMAGRVGRAGWFSSSKYPDGTPVGYIASIHEFGYAEGGIPPRMGLRQMVKGKRQEWSAKSFEAAKQVFKGKMTVDGLLRLIGVVASADIVKQIKSVHSPVLADATLQARARNLNQGSTLKLSGPKRTFGLTSTGAKPLIEPVMSKKQGYGAGGLLIGTVASDVTDKGNDK